MRVLFTLAFSLSLAAVFAQPQLRFLAPVSGFNKPVDITGAGDGSKRLFIVEQPGRIRVFDQTTESVQANDFLDITYRVQDNRNERGLLGVAFHPDFANNGFFYVNYTTIARNGYPDGSTVISRFTATPGATVVDTLTEVVLLNFAQPFNNHNAGDLAFGPDGYLYIPTGDGGGAGDPNDNGQDPQQLLGKMLRIDVDNNDAGLNYAIPPTNPFVADGSVRNEIWAFGLRNPWRISFDRETGDLWIGDVGQRQREEVNREPANHPGGLNYGWDCREGFVAYDGDDDPISPRCNGSTIYTDPAFDYPRNVTNGGFSVTGGYVYRGSAADLRGWYICADFASGNFFLYPAAGGALFVENDAPVNSPSCFGEDDDGELYVFAYGGTFYRITTLMSMPVDLISWTATATEKAVQLAWQTATETATKDFVVERSADGIAFQPILTVPAAGNSSDPLSYQVTDEHPLPGVSFYRLRQRDEDGASELFAVRTVHFAAQEQAAPVFRPNPVLQDLFVDVPRRLTNGAVTLEVFATNGQKVYTRSSLAGAEAQTFSFVLPELAAGVYTARLSYDGEVFLQKLMIR